MPRGNWGSLYRLRFHIRGFTDHVVGKQLLDFCQKGAFSHDRIWRSRAMALVDVNISAATSTILSIWPNLPMVGIRWIHYGQSMEAKGADSTSGFGHKRTRSNA